MILFHKPLEAIRTKLQQNATAVLPGREHRVAQGFHKLQSDVLKEQTPIFGTMGRHVIAELSGCSKSYLCSVDYIKATLEEAVKLAGATIITSRFHQFSPIGVSGIILLSESHCSIHTWPEEQYAAIDIYTCGEHVFPQVACNHIAAKLHSVEVFVTSLERGIKAQSGGYSHVSSSDQF